MASRPEIYYRLAGSRIRGYMQYRFSFALQAVGAFVLSFLDFVVILVIFHNLPRQTLGGWGFREVAFLYGSSYVTFKFADMLMGTLDKLPVIIRMGRFDQILTRPLGSLGQVLTSEIDVRHVGGVVQGALVLAFAMSGVEIDWTVTRAAVFASMLIGGVVIYCSIFVATNAIAFWTMDSREVANAFTYGGNAMSQFPLQIYGTWLRRFMAYVVPLAFVNYFPALYLLDKDRLQAPLVLSFISPVVATGAAMVAGLVWRSAVRHYRSTGS